MLRAPLILREPIQCFRKPGRRRAAFVTGLSLLFVAGCTSYYEEPTAEASYVAVLLPTERIHGLRVDGFEVYYWDYSPGIKILPGQRNLAFVHSGRSGLFERMFSDVSNQSDPGYSHTSGIEFEAEAGHTYELYSFSNREQIWTWVIDQSTGEMVAGDKPP